MCNNRTLCCFNGGGDAGKVMTFFLEIDFTSDYVSEIVAQRSGDLQSENFMRPFGMIAHMCNVAPISLTPLVYTVTPKNCLLRHAGSAVSLSLQCTSHFYRTYFFFEVVPTLGYI